MKLRPIDSLFGRLALLVVGVLLISHFAWFLLVRFDRSQIQTRYATEETVFLLDAVEQHALYSPHQPLPSRVSLVNLDSPEIPPPNQELEHQVLRRYLADLRERLPAGTEVRLALKRFFESSFPRLAVLAYQELPPNTEIENAGTIASMPSLPRAEAQPQLKVAA